MCIYLIQNEKNGKGYVGRTENAPEIRWRKHRSCSHSVNSKDYHHPLYRAMRKYGFGSFTYTVLEWVENKRDLPARETYFIDQVGTMTPRGYNLERYQSGGKRILRAASVQRQRVSSHSRKNGRTSRYKGVFISRNKIYCQIEYIKDVFSKGGFKSEREAAVSYDKMARYFFGGEAVCNFPDETYKREELQRHFDWFSCVPTSSVYRGVSRKKSRWVCTVVVDGRPRAFGSYLVEKEAAESYDTICLHLLKPNAKLNFPNRAPEFMDRDPHDYLFHGSRLMRYKRFGIGTVRKQPSGRYAAQYKTAGKTIYCGTHDSEEEARLEIRRFQLSDSA